MSASKFTKLPPSQSNLVAYHKAVRDGDLAAASTFLAKYGAAIVDEPGSTYDGEFPQTALARAIGNVDEKMFALLLDNGAFVSNPASNESGATPLQLACIRQNEKFVIALMERGAGVTINMRNSCGYSPLMELAKGTYTAESGRIAAFLLQNGADPTLKDRDGHNSSDIAAAFYNEKMAELIEKHHTREAARLSQEASAKMQQQQVTANTQTMARKPQQPKP